MTHVLREDAKGRDLSASVSLWCAALNSSGDVTPEWVWEFVFLDQEPLASLPYLLLTDDAEQCHHLLCLGVAVKRAYPKVPSV